MKFWFSTPDALNQLRAELEDAVLEIDDTNRLGLASRAELKLRDFGRRVFNSVFADAPSIQRLYAQSKGSRKNLRRGQSAGPPAGAVETKWPSQEELRKRREAFMRAAAAGPPPEQIEQVTEEGCELLAKLKDDSELAERLAKDAGTAAGHHRSFHTFTSLSGSALLQRFQLFPLKRKSCRRGFVLLT